MSRWHRISVGGIVYHVLNRAANRQQIFFDAAGYRAFIRLLCMAAVLTGMRVLAYCVMPNHWHLIVWPIEDNALPRFLHRLTWSHAVGYRRRWNTIGEGHVYQSPYRSFPVQTERYYYNALRYVEANALRAGLVARAEEWPWSSASCRGAQSDLLVAGPLDLPVDWIELVNQVPRQQDLDVLRECAQTGRPYGCREWTDEAAMLHGVDHTLRNPGRPKQPLREWWC